MKQVVKFKKSMKYELKDENLVRDVVNDIKIQLGQEHLATHKYDVQMLIDICNCIEKNACRNKKRKSSKKEIVLKIFSELFEDVDLSLIDASIETILNNKLVKKYDLANRFFRCVRNFFLEK